MPRKKKPDPIPGGRITPTEALESVTASIRLEVAQDSQGYYTAHEKGKPWPNWISFSEATARNLAIRHIQAYRISYIPFVKTKRRAWKQYNKRWNIDSNGGPKTYIGDKYERAENNEIVLLP